MKPKEASKMNIGLLIYGSLHTISGGYLYDRLLVDFLRKKGHNVEIFSLPWRSYWAHLGDNASAALRQQLSQAAIDLLIQDELNHPSLAWLNQWLKPRVNYPIVSIVHHLRVSENHSPWLMPIYHAVEKQYLRTLDGLIYNSQTTAQSVAPMLSPLPSAQPPSLIVYPSASHIQAPASEEIEALQQTKQMQRPLRVLFVGNVIERKGLHTLLAGLAHLQPELWQLDIVGNCQVDVHYVAQVQAQIAKDKLDQQVRFHGKVSDEQLGQHFADAHLLAVPSYEGFGIVYLEAMGYGVPVLACTVGAAHEIVENGVNGFLVAPEAPAEIAGAISQLTGNPARWLAMSQAARQRFERHPTWEAGFAELEDWLQTMVNTRRMASKL